LYIEIRSKYTMIFIEWYTSTSNSCQISIINFLFSKYPEKIFS